MYVHVRVRFARLTYDTAEECILWKEAFEEAIAEGLGDDSVCTRVYLHE